MKKDEKDNQESVAQPNRRRFLAGSAAVGALGVLMSGCEKPGGSTATPAGTAPTVGEPGFGDVAPGQLDSYYGFWSGGQSGEVRVIGVPSMRELMRIPVFNRDSATGWGATDISKKMLGGKMSGDTHHVHPSYTDGTYDGRYIYVNDKANARLARIDVETMETDKIVDIPNAQGTHGIFPQRKKTGMVLCNSEFRIPMPNDGTGMADVKQYAGTHTAIDGETMEVLWQVMVDANLDLCATDYQDVYSFATCYNSELAPSLEGMIAADQDLLYVFNLPVITKAIADGKGKRIGDSKVPVLDARSADTPYVLRIPIPKNPHGVNVDPTGKYAMCSGKLSPTVSVVEIAKLADAFAGKIKPEDCIVAQPEVGLGPLHTAFDGRGNAYTSIFIDSVITKWNIEKAIAAYTEAGGAATAAADDAKDEKNPDAKPAGSNIDPIIEKIDVNYQVGHVNASMSETKQADGKWLVALCKFSKDRFLNVGPLHADNDQLVDISGDKMKLVHDGPQYPEPHDAIIAFTSLFHPAKIQPRKTERFKTYAEWAKKDGVDLMADNKVIRDGKNVRVYMTSVAPAYGMKDFKVKAGDRVQVILTNLDNVEDLSHGFTMSNHDVMMVVNAQDTNSITFDVPKAGMFWFYCPWFCHALHLEMRGRMIVEA